jgi:hypothetical protein
MKYHQITPATGEPIYPQAVVLMDPDSGNSIRRGPKIATRGVKIDTGGSSAYVAIPNTSTGAAPSAIRLAATAACYARLGPTSEASLAIAAAGSGYVSGETVTVSGGTFSAAMTATVATAKLISASLVTAGTGYAKDDIITANGGTAATKATLTVSATQLVSANLNAAGTGYTPGNVITTAGGTASTHAALTVATTKVVSATVDTAGASGTDGTATVTGTTGTGVKFTATVTITAGAIASVDSIATGGAYTTNPTAIAAEPVTGGDLVGAILTVVMGVNTVTISAAGTYTVNSAALTQNGATSPAGGTGATFNGASYGVKTFTVSEAGIYSVTAANLWQTSVAPTGGSGVTFDTASWGVLTATVVNPGAYTVDPSNPVSTTSNLAGTGATFTATMITGAAAGDILITPYESITLDAVGFDHVAVIQVSGAGVLQISPIEN